MENDQPQVSRAPGQHEDQERLLRKLLQGQEKQEKFLEKLCNEVSKLHMVHEVRFSWPFDNELMDLVRAIFELLKAGHDGATKEEIDRILGPVLARLKTVGVPTPQIDPQL